MCIRDSNNKWYRISRGALHIKNFVPAGPHGIVSATLVLFGRDRHNSAGSPAINVYNYLDAVGPPITYGLGLASCFQKIGTIPYCYTPITYDNWVG